MPTRLVSTVTLHGGAPAPVFSGLVISTRPVICAGAASYIICLDCVNPPSQKKRGPYRAFFFIERASNVQRSC